MINGSREEEYSAYMLDWSIFYDEDSALLGGQGWKTLSSLKKKWHKKEEKLVHWT